MKIDIRTNFPQVQAQMNRLRQDIAGQALRSAMNKTLEQARTAMSREIRQEFNLPAAYVKDRLKIRRAYGKGQFSMSAELIGGDGKRRSANVIAFVENFVSLAQARKRAKDGTLKVLRVKIKKGSAKPIPGAFIGNKGRTVFRRTGKSRLPIEAVRTIDVAQMFNTKRINAKVVDLINQKFVEIFEREAKYYVARAAR